MVQCIVLTQVKFPEVRFNLLHLTLFFLHRSADFANAVDVQDEKRWEALTKLFNQSLNQRLGDGRILKTSEVLCDRYLSLFF